LHSVQDNNCQPATVNGAGIGDKKIIKMNATTNIELKKVQIFLAGSEETICFTADIYVDSIKAGYAKNDGHGGCTFYSAYPGQHALINKAEAYCKTLPDIILDISEDNKSSLKMNLEHFIDEIIDKEVAKKENASFLKKVNKAMLKYLLFTETPEGQDVSEYASIGWKNVTIEQLLQNPKGIEFIKKVLKEHSAKGMRCMNTNLPADITNEFKLTPAN
jgi:hypothetical protein